jgi:HEAT repeat protein
MVEAIARTGPDGVPELVAALANSDPRLRRNALLALRLIGPEAGEALGPIQERLADEDAQVRSHAIDVYWNNRRDPDDVAAIVAPMLGDTDTNVREAAAKVLETIGPPAIGPVVELLRSGVAAARVPSLKVLRRIGWDGPQPLIDHVVRDLVGDADPGVRTEALLILAIWGDPTPSEIRELLRHEDAVDSMGRNNVTEPGSRESALLAIIRRGPAAAENLSDVLDLLVKNGRGVENSRGIQTWRQWGFALAALRAMQSTARPAAPRLLQFVNENHNYRGIDVAWTLLAIGADPQEIVHIMVQLLLDGDTDICFHAGRLCAIASPDEARRHVSHIIPRLNPEKLADGRSALHAVWGLAPEAQEAIPVLSRLLECKQPHVARIAAKSLGDIGPEAVTAIPNLLAQLARGLQVHDYWARSAFCEAIGKMGPTARSAIPALLVELNDAPLSHRDLNRVGQRPVREVMSALGRIGDSDPAVLAAIRRHIANEDEQVQISAIRALARLIPDSPEVLTRHVKCLADSPQNRVGVILAIGRLPGDRQSAVTPLTALLDDADPEIRKAAAWTLGKIGPDASAALPSLNEVLKEWKNSLYPFRTRRYSTPPALADDPRQRLETGRWVDLDDPLVSGMKDPQFQEKSVHQVVREAIAEIEAGSNASGLPPIGK